MSFAKEFCFYNAANETAELYVAVCLFAIAIYILSAFDINDCFIVTPGTFILIGSSNVTNHLQIKTIYQDDNCF